MNNRGLQERRLASCAVNVVVMALSLLIRLILAACTSSMTAAGGRRWLAPAELTRHDYDSTPEKR